MSPKGRNRRKFLELLLQDNEAAFEECFLDEVERWFTARIACCDNCCEGFIAEWPYAYSSNDAAFQRNSIDLDLFYSQSRLCEWYTAEEYGKLLATVYCPNCDEPLSGNLYPYELPFDPPPNYTAILTELASQASQSPFLMLENDFCAAIRCMIGDLAKMAEPVSLSNFLFRGRSFPGETNPILRDFDFPPSQVVREGRYNHAGNPVLYLAGSEQTCRAEMRRTPDLFIAQFRFSFPLKVLDLVNPDQICDKHSDMLSFIVFSTLLSAKSADNGFSRPEYVFSRFVKDCALSSGFDAIRYPSTRVDAAQFNLVIINQTLTLSKYATESLVYRACESDHDSC